MRPLRCLLVMAQQYVRLIVEWRRLVRCLVCYLVLLSRPLHHHLLPLPPLHSPLHLSCLVHCIVLYAASCAASYTCTPRRTLLCLVRRNVRYI